MVTHVAFADESSYNFGRYRALALVSMRADHVSAFRTLLADHLAESGITEAKWARTKTAKARFGAEKLLGTCLNEASNGRVRADVLIWDTRDDRHAVQGRDDNANLERMYYHLCRCTFRDRWPSGASWAVYPDEMTAMGWPLLRDILHREGFRQGLRGGGLIEAHEKGFLVEGIEPVVSAEEPLVQLADLLAGLGAYSWGSFDRWEAWRDAMGRQPTLFGDHAEINLSNGDRERCKLLQQLTEYAKQRTWGVALNGTRGLRTRDPRTSRVNFWRYVPQHQNDRAPTRNAF